VKEELVGEKQQSTRMEQKLVHVEEQNTRRCYRPASSWRTHIHTKTFSSHVHVVSHLFRVHFCNLPSVYQHQWEEELICYLTELEILQELVNFLDLLLYCTQHDHGVRRYMHVAIPTKLH
jgi:hypothetical protein